MSKRGRPKRLGPPDVEILQALVAEDRPLATLGAPLSRYGHTARLRAQWRERMQRTAAPCRMPGPCAAASRRS